MQQRGEKGTGDKGTALVSVLVGPWPGAGGVHFWCWNALRGAPGEGPNSTATSAVPFSSRTLFLAAECTLESREHTLGTSRMNLGTQLSCRRSLTKERQITAPRVSGTLAESRRPKNSTETVRAEQGSSPEWGYRPDVVLDFRSG